MVFSSFEYNKLKLQYNFLLEKGLDKVSTIINIILFQSKKKQIMIPL